MTFKPLPAMTTGGLAALFLLLWLGGWQWQRYQQKRDAPEALEAALREVSVSIAPAPGARVQAVYGLVDGQSVWRRYAPGRIAGDPSGELVLVLWDVYAGVDPEPLPLDGMGTVTRLSAVFERSPTSSAFVAQNRPENDVWYGFDGQAMLRNLGFRAERPPRVVEPAEIEFSHPVLGPRTVANPYAAPQLVDPLPPQRHLGYALTWWGLALGLLAMYAAYHVSVGRLAFGERR